MASAHIRRANPRKAFLGRDMPRIVRRGMSFDHRGGLDAFLLKAKDDELAPRVLELKRQIVKKREAKAS